MIKIDNNGTEIQGDGEEILVEYISLSLKIVELFSEKLNVSKDMALNNMFKTIQFAMKRELN